MPRPTRLRSSRACAGARLERLSCFSGIGLGVLDLHEVTDLTEHAGEHRGLLMLGAAADAAEPECAQGTAMALGLPDLGPDLGDEQLRHYESSFLRRRPRRLGFSSAAGSAGASAAASGSAGVSVAGASAAVSSASGASSV